jgi:murein L,D-transpeptidase YafK
VLKKTASRYYLALLLDYPNEEDRRQFLQAQKKGRIPARAVIGGLIQIHGGGTEGMTNGCIALDNGKMKELFDRVEIGTPIVIVGTLHTNNIASEVLACLK